MRLSPKLTLIVAGLVACCQSFPIIENLCLEKYADFDLEYSPSVQPLVSYACGALDYLRLFQPNLAPASIDRFIKSTCSKLPRNATFDFSYLEECLRSGSCLKTNKATFVVGVSGSQNVFGTFNLTSVPKRTMVHNCLADESCVFEKEAARLERDWLRTVERCNESHSSEEVIQAIKNARPEEGADGDVTYSRALTRCMHITASQRVRSASIRALRRSQLCSEEMISELQEYLESNPMDRVENVMEIVDKMVSCDQLPRVDLWRSLIERFPGSNAAYATVNSLENYEEESRVMRRRSVSDQQVEQVLREASLQEDNYKFMKQFSHHYVSPTGTPHLVRATLMAPDWQTNMLVKLSVKNLNFNVENSVTFMVESPLLHDVAELVAAVNSPDLDLGQKLMSLAQKTMAYPNSAPPVKLSVVFSSHSIDLEDEQLTQFMNQLVDQLQRTSSQLLSTFDEFTFKVSAIGGTLMDVDFAAAVSKEESDLYLKVSGPEGEGLVEVYSQVRIQEQIPSMTFEGSLASDLLESKQYRFSGFFEPFTSFEDAATRCEAGISVVDQQGEKVVSLESCSRPLYLLDSENFVDQLVSTSKLITIRDLFTLNVTFDLGENGLFGFISTKKTLTADLSVKNKDILTFKLEAEPKNIWELMDDVYPVLWVQTKASVESYLWDLGSSVVVSTKIYDDESSTNEIKFFADVIGEMAGANSDAVLHTRSCRRVEESLITNLLATGRATLPDTWCFINTLRQPAQQISIDWTVEKTEESISTHELSYSVTGERRFYADATVVGNSVMVEVYQPFKALALSGHSRLTGSPADDVALFMLTPGSIYLTVPADHYLVESLGAMVSGQGMRGEYTLMAECDGRDSSVSLITPFSAVEFARKESVWELHSNVTLLGHVSYAAGALCTGGDCQLHVIKGDRFHELINAQFSSEYLNLSLGDGSSEGMCQALHLLKSPLEWEFNETCATDGLGHLHRSFEHKWIDLESVVEDASGQTTAILQLLPEKVARFVNEFIDHVFYIYREVSAFLLQ